MASSARPRLLLLGWGGADWGLIQPLLDAGCLPNLESLIQRGVMGKLYAPPPLVPPLLWTDLATGQCADTHGALGYAKPRNDPPGLAPVDAGDVAVPTLWQRVRAAGRRAAVVGWPVTHPAAGLCPDGPLVVSDAYAEARGADFASWPLRRLAVSDPALESLLSDLRLHPTEITVEQILPFVPRLAEVDQETDERLPFLVACLARAASIHGAGTWLAEYGEWDFLAVQFEFIERLSAAFMRYRAPRLAQVSERDFAIYAEVVDGAYRFMDLLLGRYLELVPEDTRIMIVSPHGCLSGGLRPSPLRQGLGDPPARQYRELGVLVCAGQGLKQDELVFGATVYDVAPTVLHLLDLPVPRILQGQVLTRLLSDPAEPVYSEATDEPPTPSVPFDDPDWANGRLLELVALGYLPPIPGDPELAAEQAALQRLDHLAGVKIARRRFREALAVLEEMLALAPDRPGTLLAMARCHYALDDLRACRAVTGELALSGMQDGRLDFLLGQICLKEGDTEAARAHLERADAAVVGGHHLKERIGRVFLEAGDDDAAERAFRHALAIDPDYAPALGGLGMVLARRGEHGAAIESFLHSITMLRQQPQVHFHLGLSLAAVGQPAAALQALHNALGIEPKMSQARTAIRRIERAMVRTAQQAVKERKAPGC